jgi:lipopolysaccharide transport system ATP-binding protein
MRRAEIERKFDDIVAFAETEVFLDTPLKRYSSGMYVRLAFAVAAHLEPEILLVDEVLAVGDAAFQKKCLGKMGEVAEGGRTVLFVSHNMGAVQQLTRRSVLLDCGTMLLDGPSPDVIANYLEVSMERRTTVYDAEKVRRPFPELLRQIEFVSLELEGLPSAIVSADADVVFRITVKGNEAVDRFRFGITLWQVSGTPVGTAIGPEAHSMGKDELAVFQVTFKNLGLAPGRYCFSLSMGRGSHREGRTEFDVVAEVLYFEVVSSEDVGRTQASWSPTWGPIQLKEPIVERF